MADPFRELAPEYEAWFETHEPTYRAELEALEALRPAADRSLSVGVGTGRFAAPLGVEYGIEPSPEMGVRARDRGIEVVRGVGERLPIRDGSFEFVLAVTTVCFFDDLQLALSEAHRVLEPGGHVLIGFVDRESPVGRQYEATKGENPFYREATFYTAAELQSALESAGFAEVVARQTVFTDPESMTEPDPVEPGTGDGSFVAVRARR
jgi:SAM-dependent methyltransferase